MATEEGVNNHSIKNENEIFSYLYDEVVCCEVLVQVKKNSAVSFSQAPQNIKSCEYSVSVLKIIHIN